MTPRWTTDFNLRSLLDLSDEERALREEGFAITTVGAGDVHK